MLASVLTPCGRILPVHRACYPTRLGSGLGILECALLMFPVQATPFLWTLLTAASHVHDLRKGFLQ